MKFDLTKKEITGKIPVAGDLCGSFLAKLRPHVEVRELPAASVLFVEGEPGDCAYVIARGSVQILKEQDGSPVALARRGPGDIIGEMALIDDLPRFASAACETACELFVLSRSSFLGLLAARRDIAQEVLRMMTARIREGDANRLEELEATNEDLRLSQIRLEAALVYRDRILAMAPYPIVVTDSQDRINLLNPAAEMLLGNRGSNDLWERAAPRDPTVPARAAEGLRNKASWRGEIEVDVPAGRRLLCKMVAVHIPDSGSGKSARLWVFEDVTEVRTLQEQAIEQYGLAMKGEMAGEIAHELNNYLTILSGNIELLPIRLRSNDPTAVNRTLENIQQAIQQMGVFTDTLLRSRHPMGQRSQIDLNEFLLAQIAFLRPQKRFKTVPIKTDLGTSLPKLECDPCGLQQVIYNLLMNSADALSGAGITEPAVFIATRYDPERGEVRLSVADNGSGIPPEVMSRLFRERVTSKPAGHGIGTLTVLRIVEEHGGRIVAGQRDGGGAEFVITLPIHAVSPQKD